MDGLNIINKIKKGVANTAKNNINTEINKMKKRIKTNVKNDKNTKFENELNLQKYIERTGDKTSKSYVYPWKNFDFDYKGEVKKRFNPKKMGFKNDPYLNTFITNVSMLPNYIGVLLDKSVPDNQSKPGISDLKNASNKGKINKKYDKLGEPYPGFSKEYPTEVKNILGMGKYSSSYFQKSGYCPAKGISHKDCLNKKYYWITTDKIFTNVKTNFKNMENSYNYVNLYNSNGQSTSQSSMLKDIRGNEYFIVKGKNGNFSERLNKNVSKTLNNNHFIEIKGGKYNGLYFQNMAGKCQKPRYAYIENKPGSMIGDGLIGSVQQSIMELNPMEMTSILLTEKSTNNKFKVLPCKEGFITDKSLLGHNDIIEIFILLIVISLCLIIILLTFKK